MDPKVRQYMMQKYFGAQQPDILNGADDAVNNAQKQQEMSQFAGIAAGAADNIANAMNQPVVLHNRMQDLGKAPAMIEGRQQHTDMSGVQRMADNNLKTAQGERDQALQMMLQQRKEELAQEAMAKRQSLEDERWGKQFSGQESARNETARHNKAMEALARQKASATSNSNDPLAKVPPQLRDNYLSSQTKVKEFDSAVTNVDSLIDQAATFSLESHLTPKALGGGDYDSLKAKIAAAIMNRVPGIRSDADFRNIVEPMIPHPSDPPALAAKRAQELKDMLKSNRPVNEVGNVYMPQQEAPASQGNGATGSWGLTPEEQTELEMLEKKFGGK